MVLALPRAVLFGGGAGHMGRDSYSQAPGPQLTPASLSCPWSLKPATSRPLDTRGFPVWDLASIRLLDFCCMYLPILGETWSNKCTAAKPVHWWQHQEQGWPSLWWQGSEWQCGGGISNDNSKFSFFYKSLPCGFHVLCSRWRGSRQGNNNPVNMAPMNARKHRYPFWLQISSWQSEGPTLCQRLSLLAYLISTATLWGKWGRRVSLLHR